MKIDEQLPLIALVVGINAEPTKARSTWYHINMCVPGHTGIRVLDTTLPRPRSRYPGGTKTKKKLYSFCRVFCLCRADSRVSCPGSLVGHIKTVVVFRMLRNARCNIQLTHLCVYDCA